MEMEAAEGKLKAFVAGKTKLIAADEVTADTKLFSSGLLDSLVFVDLILFIETTFKVKLTSSSGADMGSMDSIAQIIQVVSRASARKPG